MTGELPSQPKATVLVVDDEAAVRRVLVMRLQLSGYRVVCAEDGEQALELFHSESPDLIVLDVMLPKLDGFAVCRRLRAESCVPIIFLSAVEAISERVAGLDLGADDYLPKPFEPKELILRIKNILDKTKKTNLKRIIEFQNIKIDLNKLIISRNEKEFKINNTEKKILEKMINNPGKTFSRLDIGKFIDLDKERSIDVIITRLRKKIEMDPKNPKFLQTSRGAGYVLWIE